MTGWRLEEDHWVENTVDHHLQPGVRAIKLQREISQLAQEKAGKFEGESVMRTRALRSSAQTDDSRAAWIGKGQGQGGSA